MRGQCIGALLAVSLASAQPAIAAEAFRHSAAAFDHRQAAFGGLTVRMRLGEGTPVRPEARLQLTTYRINPAKPAPLRNFNPNGLELGLSKGGNPMLFSGGRNSAELRQKMGLDTTTTLLIVGGLVVVVVVVAAAVAGATPTPGPHEGAFD